MSETLSVIVSTGRRARVAPALYVGLAGDAPRTPPMRISLHDVDRIELGRGASRSLTRATIDGAEVLTLVLADARTSTTHARISRVAGAWVLEDRGSKNGTLIAGERRDRKTLEDGDVIIVGHTALLFRSRGGEAGNLDAPVVFAPGLATLSPELVERFTELTSAARSTVPIEITGETGTGKELVARAVHAFSTRSGQLAAINCGALTETLLGDELFGHKKGAYTGADADRPGLIRTADRGTLFLDEVAELGAGSQAALLRVLQEGEIVPVGGDRPVEVDLRLVTATHKNLDAEVDAGRFRADLRARVLGVKIALPPLRERREDLALIIAALLDRLAPGRDITFSIDAVAALYAHRWPLNVRELERTLAAALAIGGSSIEPRHLGLTAGSTPPIIPDDDDQLRLTLTASIERHQGNLAAVARELGKDRTQIRRWMKKLGLSRGDD